MRGILSLAVLEIAAALAFVAPAQEAGAVRPSLPANAKRYEPEQYTQSLSKLNDRPTIERTRIDKMANTDWHQSGGIRGLKDVTSEKFRTNTAPHRVELVTVKNGFVRTDLGELAKKGQVRGKVVEEITQREFGIVRTYPDGTRFDDVLRYKGETFEHRMREKRAGLWVSKVLFKDATKYPPGYTGLTVTCASCHEQAGTGGYAEGLVPGGDSVFSDPIDWDVVTKGR